MLGLLVWEFVSEIGGVLPLFCCLNCLADVFAEMAMTEGESGNGSGGASVIRHRKQVPAHSKLLNDSRFYRFLPRDSGGVSWRRVSKPVWLLTNERHGNSLLKNEQHVFTQCEE